MKKSFIECPYGCKDGDKPLELTVSGSSMHVKVKHPEKFEEFRKNFAEHKKKAVIKDTATRTPIPGGAEPPRIEDTEKAGDKPEAGKEKKEASGTSSGKSQPSQAGDDKPATGKSFLREFDEWCDSHDF